MKNIFGYLTGERAPDYTPQQLEVLKGIENELELQRDNITPKQIRVLERVEKIIARIPKSYSERGKYLPRIDKALRNIIWRTADIPENNKFIEHLVSAKEVVALYSFTNLIEWMEAQN